MKNIILILIITITSLPFAYGNDENVNKRLSCVLKKPFILGASISAGYKDLGDATAAYTKLNLSKLTGGDSSYFGHNPALLPGLQTFLMILRKLQILLRLLILWNMEQ